MGVDIYLYIRRLQYFIIKSNRLDWILVNRNIFIRMWVQKRETFTKTYTREHTLTYGTNINILVFLH